MKGEGVRETEEIDKERMGRRRRSRRLVLVLGKKVYLSGHVLLQ